MNDTSLQIQSAPSENRQMIPTYNDRQSPQTKVQKVLVLDGEQRSALAATRSLGKKGVHVVVGGESPQTLAGHSTYCSETLCYPSPARSSTQFVETIREEIRRREITVLLPMTEITTSLVLKERSQFREARIPFASFELFEKLADKWKVLELARSLGLSIPATYHVSNLSDLPHVISEIEFPVVLKPHRSRIYCNNRWIESSVKYAHSPKELLDLAQRLHCFSHHPFVVQELIHGHGQGIFALYEHGNPLVFFAHRRLREKPPTGGVSVLSESVNLDSRAFLAAKKFLDHVRWHGVAMVEFKVTDSGVPYLMEINPRFWGSLQLAIDAGVDFPWLTYQLAVGHSIKTIASYKVGVRNRWLLGDAAHLYSSLFRNGRGLRLPFFRKWQSLVGFMDFFDRNTRYEINRWEDLGPFFFELKKLLTRR